MLLTLLLTAFQPVQGPASPPAEAELALPVPGFTSTRKDCPRASYRHAVGKAPMRPRRFNELPPGRLELAVLREFDGCPIPAIVREGLGGPPAVRE